MDMRFLFCEFQFQSLLSIWFANWTVGGSNNTQAVRTILFDTKNHLGLNAGVILGWCALSCVTIPLFTVLMRRRDVRAHQKQIEEKKGGEKA
jgi:hypothetical protein